MSNLGGIVTDTMTGGPFGWQLIELVGELGDVIDRRVRPGVTRSQLRVRNSSVSAMIANNG